MNKHYFLLFLIVFYSCLPTERHKLSEEEKSFNPYNIGNELIFESNFEEIDTFFITDIDLIFNDGIGITEYKQSLRVLEGKEPEEGDIHDQRTFLLEIGSGGSKEPTYVELRNFEGDKLYLAELLQRPRINLITEFGTHRDVISIEGNSDQKKYASGIYNIQWSLENGIVQFQKGDSSIWTLKHFKP